MKLQVFTVTCCRSKVKSSCTCNVLDVVCFSQRGLDSGDKGDCFRFRRKGKLFHLVASWWVHQLSQLLGVRALRIVLCYDSQIFKLNSSFSADNGKTQANLRKRKLRPCETVFIPVSLPLFLLYWLVLFSLNGVKSIPWVSPQFTGSEKKSKAQFGS